MKNYKKIILSFLVGILIVLNFNIVLCGEQYVKIKGSKSARVIQIIDGDSIKVQLLDTKELALVRLIGVDAQGYDEAVKYMINRILGANVILNPDTSINDDDGVWNHMYVLYNGTSINNELIQKGYGIVNSSYANASIYNQILASERTAKENNIEIWNYGVRANSTIGNYTAARNNVIDEKININTATEEMLRDRLKGVTASISSNIVKYRTKNPFTTVDELKFVDGITREIFTDNVNNMVVYTNLNTASQKELLTLNLITENEADEIITYRGKDRFDRVSTLKSKDILDESLYNKIKNYVTINNNTQDEISINSTVVNPNTASRSELISAGVSPADAEVIVSYHKNGYTFKTLMELSNLSKISLSVTELNYLEDNLKVRTDINNAKDSELISVFGNEYVNKIKNGRTFKNISELETIIGSTKYNREIKALVYTGNRYTDYVNLNTANETQLREVGFITSEINQITAARGMKTSLDLPFDISKFNDKVTLYTNINTATEAELKTLNNGITQTIIDNITNYRANQSFGSMDEVRTFFINNNATALYNNIADYITIR